MQQFRTQGCADGAAHAELLSKGHLQRLVLSKSGNFEDLLQQRDQAQGESRIKTLKDSNSHQFAGEKSQQCLHDQSLAFNDRAADTSFGLTSNTNHKPWARRSPQNLHSQMSPISYELRSTGQLADFKSNFRILGASQPRTSGRNLIKGLVDAAKMKS